MVRAAVDVRIKCQKLPKWERKRFLGASLLFISTGVLLPAYVAAETAHVSEKSEAHTPELHRQFIVSKFTVEDQARPVPRDVKLLLDAQAAGVYSLSEMQDIMQSIRKVYSRAGYSFVKVRLPLSEKMSSTIVFVVSAQGEEDPYTLNYKGEAPFSPASSKHVDTRKHLDDATFDVVEAYKRAERAQEEKGGMHHLEVGEDDNTIGAAEDMQAHESSHVEDLQEEEHVQPSKVGVLVSKGDSHAEHDSKNQNEATIESVELLGVPKVSGDVQQELDQLFVGQSSLDVDGFKDAQVLLKSAYPAIFKSHPEAYVSYAFNLKKRLVTLKLEGVENAESSRSPAKKVKALVEQKEKPVEAPKKNYDADVADINVDLDIYKLAEPRIYVLKEPSGQSHEEGEKKIQNEETAPQPKEDMMKEDVEKEQAPVLDPDMKKGEDMPLSDEEKKTLLEEIDPSTYALQPAFGGVDVDEEVEEVPAMPSPYVESEYLRPDEEADGARKLNSVLNDGSL